MFAQTMAWLNQFADLAQFDDGMLYGSTFSSAFDDMSMYGSNEQEDGFVRIAGITDGMQNINLRGVVIAKEDSRKIISKKDINSARYVLSFTLRDSEHHFINVSAWGKEDFISNLSSGFHISDAVDVCHVIIKSKAGSEDKYQPWTPSCYAASMMEPKGRISQYAGSSCAQLQRLVHVPCRPSTDVYTVDDIMAGGKELSNQSVNVLAAVVKIGNMQQFDTKAGRRVCKQEVMLIDSSSTTGLTLLLWQPELIMMTTTWTLMQTVLFAVDVKLSFDEFKQKMIATATSRTLITVNPECHEARTLYDYCQTLPLPADTDCDLASGDGTVVLCTVQEIKAMMRQLEDQPATGHATMCTVIATITQCDLDGCDANVLSYCCSKCKQLTKRRSQRCDNELCKSLSPAVHMTFDLRLTIADQTGSLDNIRFSGDVASAALGCKADDFQQFSDKQKTQVKWQVLLERCKLGLRVWAGNGVTSVRVTHFSLASLDDAVNTSL